MMKINQYVVLRCAIRWFLCDNVSFGGLSGVRYIGFLLGFWIDGNLLGTMTGECRGHGPVTQEGASPGHTS